jgi:hypothetical protein
MNQITSIATPPPTRSIGRTEQLVQTAINSGFDHLVKGDVIIKKLKNKHQYRITFSKVYGDRFLFYQVFNKDNTDNVNDQRFAGYIPIKNIENLYKDTNNANTILNKPLFTPTTIMELPNFRKYAFVINKVYFNSHKRLVFMVSTKEIKLQNNTSKKLTQIPSGKFKHVRFDVDDSIIRPTLRVLWSSTEKICSNNPNATLSYDGKTFPYCNKPLPPYPEICGDTLYTDFIRLDGDSSPCRDYINKLIRDKALPDAIEYLFITSSVFSLLSRLGLPCRR